MGTTAKWSTYRSNSLDYLWRRCAKRYWRHCRQKKHSAAIGNFTFGLGFSIPENLYPLIAEAYTGIGESSLALAQPAIALTAYNRTTDRTSTLHAGFDAHVPKPVDTAAIITVIAELARR